MKRLSVAVATLSVALGMVACQNGGSVKLTNEADSLSYAQGQARGAMLAQQIAMAKEQGTNIDKDQFLKGFQEGANDTTKFSYYVGAMTGVQLAQGMKDDANAKLNIFFAAFKEALMADSTTKLTFTTEQADSLARIAQEKAYQAQMEKQFAPNKTKGAEFIANFKKEEGVQTTASGLAYKVLQAGKGISPAATDTVLVKYVGTTIDGNEFDKNEEGMEFPANQVIPGWTEMLQLMKEGEKVKVVIPQELAYGERGSYPIEPFSTLVFEVELIKVKKAKEALAN